MQGEVAADVPLFELAEFHDYRVDVFIDGVDQDLELRVVQEDRVDLHVSIKLYLLLLEEGKDGLVVVVYAEVQVIVHGQGAVCEGAVVAVSEEILNVVAGVVLHDIDIDLLEAVLGVKHLL